MVLCVQFDNNHQQSTNWAACAAFTPLVLTFLLHI
jgi:hypothetical protein